MGQVVLTPDDLVVSVHACGGLTDRVLDRALERGDSVVPFLEKAREWDGSLVSGEETFVTAIGAGTTYPDYKPAPFIVSSRIDGVDMVTVVTEGIFSYCGVKVKIDTDRFLGTEQSVVRASGEAVGHVTTSEYGSQMLSLGGVPESEVADERSWFGVVRVFLRVAGVRCCDGHGLLKPDVVCQGNLRP